MKIQDMVSIIVDAMKAELGTDTEIVSRKALASGLQALFEEIKTTSVYNPVRIPNFGTFKTRHIKARHITNKMTKGLSVYVPARDIPAFTPAKAYKQKVASPK